jgi:serine protease inhibitor
MNFQTSGVAELRQRNAKFAFSLYSAVAGAHRGNLVMAPLSFSIALSLLLNGADAQTRHEILEVTKLVGMSLEDINQQNLRLQKTLGQINAGGTETFILANSLWASLPLAFAPAFLEAGRRYYSAEVMSVERQALPARVSAWSQEKTRGLVDMKLQETDFALLSATYFKGSWERPFKEENTKLEKFHPSDAAAKTVAMMSQQGEYWYFTGTNFQLVALPYSTARMYFLLPKKGSLFSKHAIHEIEQQVLRDDWIMTQPLAHLPGLVKIPKFKLRYDGDFLPVLEKLGLQRMFDSFDSLRPAVTHPEGAKVEKVLQNSTITVDEKGAEAASVLAMTMRAGSAMGLEPRKPFEFIADRPFCFWITDDQTGSILFVGRVEDPQ